MGATSKAGFVEEDPGNIEVFRFAAARGRWKLHLDLLSGEPTRWRLFDLEVDPGERVDLALAHPEVVEELGVPLLARAQSMRPPHTPEASSMTSAAAPEWVSPERDGVLRYDDLAGRFRLEWTGSEAIFHHAFGRFVAHSAASRTRHGLQARRVPAGLTRTRNVRSGTSQVFQ